MTFKEIRKKSGMTQKRFSEFFGIPRRTIENWEAGVNKCPAYLLDLMKYKLDMRDCPVCGCDKFVCYECGERINN